MASTDNKVPNSGTHPFINLVLAGIALRGGGSLLHRAVDQFLRPAKPAVEPNEPATTGQKLTQTLAGAALVRIATRSVPGAILIGGGMLAKTLYDRRKRIEAERAEQPEG